MRGRESQSEGERVRESVGATGQVKESERKRLRESKSQSERDLER